MNHTAANEGHPPLPEAPGREDAFTFNCEGDALVGVIHHGDANRDLGLLTIVAGGPQYRGGCGRQLTELGRRLAQEGIHVMRFDHRGVGDSEGSFRGFEDMLEDLRAAIATFRQRVPALKRIVLYGGCDAASAALINAYQLDGVVAIIAANPWITTTASQQSARRRHYWQRLSDVIFWKKLFSGQYGLSTLRDLLHSLRPKNAGLGRHQPQSHGRQAAGNFLDRMLHGLHRFDGQVAFLLSGRSVVSREFEHHISTHVAWAKELAKPSRARNLLPNSDQTFSDRHSRSELLGYASRITAGLSDQA